ncbi:MAG: hypothetical protein IID44_12270 [Planctomycetes bacterium]|nr:hypothetical protein [Planctomycetota bacterium]
MNDHELDERLRKHYGEQQLSPHGLAEIREIVGTVGAVEDDVVLADLAPDSPPWNPWISVAAGLVTVAVLAAVFIWAQSQPGGGHPPTAEIIAEEIATNHNRDMPVEIETDAFDSLAEKLDKLDFRPISPGRLDERELQMVGGRYCKIQGQIAAQIKLRDAAGRTWTLYECRDSKLLSGVRARRVKTLGIEVELWREAGVLLGLAGPPD